MGEIKLSKKMGLNGSEINPFEESNQFQKFLDVGIRNINALLTLGRAEVGIIAGSGVGKSVLLSMITKSTNADVVVVSLIGERVEN